MTSPTEGNWTPPDEAAPVVPPAPTDEVTTGPVAEAPADLPEPAADPTPVADPAPEVSPTPPGSGADVQPPAQVVTAGNASPVTVERSVYTAAARAFHVLGHVEEAARVVRAEIQKHVPPEVLAAAETEALALLRGLL